jgi:AcrR family transcriptional regulator
MGRRPKDKSRNDSKTLRDAWLKKFLPIFNEFGFQSFTMDELALRVKSSKSTIYKFFKSKEEIVGELLELKLSEIGNYQKVLFDYNKSYHERYLDATEIACKGLTNISAIFMNDIKSTYTDKWKLITQFKEIALSKLSEFYAEGIEKGYINNSMNPDILVKFDDIVLTAITEPSYLQRQGVEMSDLFLQYFMMKSEGILIKNLDNKPTKIRLDKMKENLQEYAQNYFVNDNLSSFNY